MRCAVGFVVVLLGGVPAFAQSASPASMPHTTVGGFWGANLASVAWTPRPPDVKSQQWGAVGGTVDMPIGRAVSIDARAMWNRKGAKLTLASGGLTQLVRADYVSMPVLLKVSAPGRELRPYAVGGPELSIRTRARVQTTLGLQSLDEDARDVTRRTDLAVSAGGGVERVLPHARLFVEGLYSHGLRNVVVPDAQTSAVRTRTFTLLAGLRF